jgi:hypothetical protein
MEQQHKPVRSSFPRRFLVILGFLAMGRVFGDYKTIYVSPAGNDINMGTFDLPLKTIAKAFEKAKASAGSMTGDIAIKLRGGYYPQTQPLILDQTHGGRNGNFIRLEPYLAEKPIIGGGQQVTEWINCGNGIYKAQLAAGLRIRQAYIDGQRLQRARSSDIVAPKALSLNVGGGYLDYSPIGEFAGLANWKNLSQVELVAKNEWKCFRGRIASVAQNSVSLQQPFWTYARAPFHRIYTFNDPAWVENAFELLDKPGEWYYNPVTGYMYLKPLIPGQLSTSQIYVGIAERLIAGKGIDTIPIKNLKFTGIGFAHTGWFGAGSDSGFSTIQVLHLGSNGTNMIHMPAALTMEYVQNVFVQNCYFTHLGGDAINFGKGTKNCTFFRNKIEDVSGSGLILGEVGSESYRLFPPAADKVSDNRIAENYLVKAGQEFYSSNGIFMGYVERTLVENNDLYDLPSTGISLGWGWGDDNYSNSNTIRKNRVGLFGRVLNDNGGIYILGKQSACLVEGNWIYRQQSGYGGIYLDNGATNVHVTGNFVDHSDAGGRWLYIQYINYNGLKQATGNTIDNNYYRDWRQCSDELKSEILSVCAQNTFFGEDGGKRLGPESYIDTTQTPPLVIVPLLPEPDSIKQASGIPETSETKSRQLWSYDFPVTTASLPQTILDLTFRK